MTRLRDAHPGARPAAGMAWRIEARHARVLRASGATVGKGAFFGRPLTILNGSNGCGQLTIGDGVCIGADVVIDLAGPVTIESRATIGHRSTLGGVQHGHGAGAAPIVIGAHTRLEPAVMVLPGVTVGAGVTVEGNTLIAADVPAGAVVASPVLKQVGARA